MVWHHMSFEYLYPFVLAQSSDYFLQVCSILIVYDLSSIFRNEHYVVLAHPFCMCQTACLVCHKISFHCSNRLDILFYHVWRFFGITFVTHPHSGWLSVSHFVLNLPKGVIQKGGSFPPFWVVYIYLSLSDTSSACVSVNSGGISFSLRHDLKYV